MNPAPLAMGRENKEQPRMLGSVARKIFGTQNDRLIKGLGKTVTAINALEPEMEKLSDAALKGKTDEFRQRIAGGAKVDDLLIEAFAVVREAAKRALGLRPFDVQLLGGIVLHQGKISEMKTGEGKTLVATLPVYLNSLAGDGVHVVTVNDYLARRDADWMGQVYGFLGLTTGVVIPGMDDAARQAAYRCDVTYATNNELGFDYLRDNMKYRRSDMVQRRHAYAIVDEVDSILIDEARTPLIISGPAENQTDLYVAVDELIPELTEEHYEIDEKSRQTSLTDEGNEFVEQRLQAAGLLKDDASLYDPESVTLVHHVNQALRAYKLFQRDKDYIVKNGKVIIIDEFTGRMMEGRRFSDGLHQALEAKERQPIQAENVTLASVTFQNYFRLYDKLAGMTGTAMTEADEFASIYKLEVVEIPTNVPVAREDDDDLVFRTSAEKYRAIVEAIADAHRRGQPALVGTTSIERSEQLSGMLSNPDFLTATAKFLRELADKIKPGKEAERREYLVETASHLMAVARTRKGIPHKVLNARYHEQEAGIVAMAGVPGAVTIATNMAGRGTDIQLGGNPDIMIAHEAAEKGVADDEIELSKIRDRVRAEVSVAKKKAIEAGGLWVIATERHESRRIDNQLRGRSGRQGDPGRSTFYLSLQDDLMRIFGSERMDSMLQKLGLEEGEAIVHSWVNKAIEKAQGKVEQRNFDIRKNLLKYDDVMNDQRKAIFEQRLEVMEADDVADVIRDMRHELIDELVAEHIPARAYADQWKTEELYGKLLQYFGKDIPVMAWADEEGVDDDVIRERLYKATDEIAAKKAAEFGANTMRQVEKQLLLQTLDHHWREHLLTLDHLRSVIGFRGYAQRDPLNEYKSEAFQLFESLLARLRRDVTAQLSHVQIIQRPAEELADGAEKTPERVAEMAEAAAAPAGEPAKPVRNPKDPATWGKVGRNEACPCGSGKKFKQCHGQLR